MVLLKIPPRMPGLFHCRRVVYFADVNNAKWGQTSNNWTQSLNGWFCENKV